MKIGQKLLSVILCAVMLVCSLPVVSFGAAAQQLKLNETTTITIDFYESDISLYTFTAPSNGYYQITSYSYTLDSDPFFYCYDENDYDVTTGDCDDTGVLYDFNEIMYFEKGETYNFEFSSYAMAEFDEYDVRLSKINSKLPVLSLNKTSNVSVNENNRSNFFSFVPAKSGYYAFYSEGADDSFGYVYDSSFTQLNKNDDSAQGHNFYTECELEAGETYYFETTSYSVFELVDEYQVGIKPVEVIEEIVITDYPYNTTFYEGFEYETLSISGLEADLIFSDGSVVHWVYDDTFSGYDENGMSVVCDWYYDDENWEVFVEIWTPFASASFYPEPIDVPVKDIRYYSGTPIVLVEGIDSYYDETVDMTLYNYSIPEDTKFRVDFYDGTYEILTFGELSQLSVFGAYDNQMFGEEWGLGYNEITVSLFYSTCTISAQVIENPVESIKLNSAPTREYVFGDELYGFIDSDVNPEVYLLVPFDMTGLSFTVKYKDGTSNVFTDEDIDEQGFVDGYYMSIYNVQTTGAGKYQAGFNYLGFDVTYDVTVTDERPYILGDTDLDGEMSILDATEIQLVMALLKDWRSENAMLAADVDGDGEISVMDATEIQLILAGLI